MLGCSPESVLLVNAEVDSMGGVIDGGVGLDNKTSPRRAAIEKAQAELRLEYDVREERKRELEFLEKGGNPLDFKLGHATSISFQSTSVTDQLVTSEAKDSFPCTASPHGDSVESSGRPGAPTCREANSADNLFLYEGEKDTVKGQRNNSCRGRSNINPSEQFSQLDGCNSLKESDDSGMFRFVVKSQAYARRNRSRSSHENARVPSTELASGGDGDGDGSAALPSTRCSSRDAKGSLSETKCPKDRNVSSVCNSKSTSPNGNVVLKNVISDNQMDKDLDGPQAHESNCGLTKGGEVDLDVALSMDSLDRKRVVHRQANDGPVTNVTVTEATCLVDERLDAVLPVLDCVPGAASAKMETVTNVGQTNGFATAPKDVKSILKEGAGNITAFNRKDNIDSELCRVRIIHAFERNTLTDQAHSLRKSISHGNSIRQASEVDEASDGAVAGTVKLNHEANDDHNSIGPSPKSDVLPVKVEEYICDKRSGNKDEMNPSFKIVELDGPIVSEAAGKLDNLSDDSSNLRKEGQCHVGRVLSTKKSSNCELLEANHTGRILTAVPAIQTSTEIQLKVATKARENSILEEARIIEAKRKRIAELSVGSFPLEYRRKSHWDFVLEEMAWLANDFTQERVWKTTAAAQLARCAATGARSRFGKQNLSLKQKKIAYTLAKAVMQFWHSAEVLNNDVPRIGLGNGGLTLVGSHKANEDHEVEEKNKYFEKQNTGKNTQVALQGYAARFLKYSGSLDCSIEAEAPVTPDRMFDSGVVDISCEDQFSGESLFYTIPPGAMEEYRKTIELYWSQNENTGVNMDQEEVDTSTYDNVAEYYYEEEEREMGSYYLHGGFDGRKSSKHMHKKRKDLQNSYGRSYEVAADFPYGYERFNDYKVGNQPSSLIGKRPNNLNVGPIPTKRVRTAAARQRVLCPFSSGAVGGVPMASKTDASSGDTSSFQDDQSTIVGGNQIRKNMEVESTGEFERQTPFDGSEVSMKPKKKKKPKHILYKNRLNSSDTGGGFAIGQGALYGQRWQPDSMVQIEQRELSKKRMESRALESNGNSGLFVQHAAKRPKTMKQLHDTSPESIAPVAGSIPSPVASQMSNLSNPNKFMKMIAGRDRGGRKNKGLKLPGGLSGSESQWSTFEDQALVVLVHDMGPNWELVSDAINSTLQFKCIFRKPKECKERHKFLMDKNAGDGADSAEDSGSSQPYPSTLPGIPKGSARQLFQRLQGPMEEDTLKAHFEKIILIGQKLHSRRNKNDNQDQKQITPVHNSHVVSLSHVCPNNLNGVILTPRDLCDATTSNSDILSLGCQNSHNSGLTLQNQGPLAPTLPTSGANSLLQGSSGTVLNNSSPSSALNVLTRDGQRYNMPRPPSLPIDEHQKMQRYNQMLSSRNMQHAGLTAPGSLPNDRGVRILPGGGGMGMMSGLNRGMLPRPGYQGMGSPAILNMVSSGSMLSSNGLGMPIPANMHNGTVSGQGNHMMRTREALHMMRNHDDQRQMMMQELQMQVTQGNSQGIPAFNGISTGFSNATVSAPVQSFSVQQQPPMTPQQSYVLNNTHHLQGSNQAPSPQQQAILLRLAKERNQHRILQQQQQQHHQFAASNSSIHHVLPQSQHAISSSIPNNSQIQQQTSPQSASLPSSSSSHSLTSSASPLVPASSQTQQKHHLPPNGLGRNMAAGGGSLPNQMLKQRQRQQQQQQLQQPGRQHPQQRPQSQAQQPSKVKGTGRGNMMNPPIDASSVNGLAPVPGNQGAEKSEQSMHLMSAQGVFSGTGSPAVHSVKSSAHLQPPNQCSQPQKMLPGSPSSSLKQLPQLPSHQENINQGQVSPATSGQTLLTSHQPGLPLTVASQPQQQQQQQMPQRQVCQSQLAGLRMLQQNCQVNSDIPVQSSVDHVPVNDTFQMATSASPVQCTGDSTGAVASISPTSAHSHWKPSETLFDSGTPTSTAHLASIRNATLSSSVGAEPLSLPSQGLTQRQLSVSIPKHGHNAGAQWQPPSQQQILQPPPAPPQQSPPPLALQQHSPPSHQSQTLQHLQSGQTVQYSRPANSGSG
ncbi:hypothetical protein Sjap_009866 [Stephania japonica]|uniref:Chromatin modification-related protein EAF1 B-like n=1 Tax=Stephania japonica TaxID=461633 RepID=A0AAP0J8I9_9MAGN